MPLSRDQGAGVLIRELLFADAAALTAHTEEALQWLISCFTCACREFGLTISLKMTKILGQDLSSIPSISIGDYTLEGWRISSTLVSPSPATSPWMPNWTQGLARQQQQWLALKRGPRKTPCWPPTLRWRSIKPVYSACYSMAMRHGLHTPAKNADSMPSTCTASEGFWASPGRTMSQTRMSWLRQEYQACLPCLPKGASASLVTSATCQIAKSPRMCCMASLPLAPDL